MNQRGWKRWSPTDASNQLDFDPLHDPEIVKAPVRGAVVELNSAYTSRFAGRCKREIGFRRTFGGGLPCFGLLGPISDSQGITVRAQNLKIGKTELRISVPPRSEDG